MLLHLWCPSGKAHMVILSWLQSAKCPPWEGSSRMQGAAARRRLREFLIPVCSSDSLSLMGSLSVPFPPCPGPPAGDSLPNISSPTRCGKFRVHLIPYSRLFMMITNSVRHHISPHWITLPVKSSVCKEYMQQGSHPEPQSPKLVRNKNLRSAP